ncbi:hypothetical protein OH76DRAFT_645738 [Lentinus brumalis]|uniref:Uncharacterized protein n=1 Tax=Lentinus brumalis TaxID=2498619 RepID=A0A371D7Z0_9APHY|nr:hypothetical protein OH76DRAFT_645738 [Polyporus brumalis]
MSRTRGTVQTVEMSSIAAVEHAHQRSILLSGVTVQKIVPSEIGPPQNSVDTSTEEVAFVQHVADVMAVLGHASVPITLSENLTPEYASDDGHVSEWIHGRCYRKIYHRIQESKRIWGDGVLKTALASWKPSEEEHGRFQAREVDIPPVYAEVLKTCGFEVRTFDFDTAPDWIRCISTILKQLEDAFAIEPTSKRVRLAVSTRRLNRA